MSSNPSGSTSYRDQSSQDDDDDLDDLDDVLASFNAPQPDPVSARQPSTTISPSKSRFTTARPQPESDDADEDFEASLIEGMESLLRQLAGDHPPGPMPDTNGHKSPSLTPAPIQARKQGGEVEGEGEVEGGPGRLSVEEEEKAWQKAVEMMLSGEGLEALGLDKDGHQQIANPQLPATAPVGNGNGKPDFQETIRRTMESLNQPAASGSGRAGSGGPPDLAAMLAQLGSDPSALDGLGGDGDEFGGLLDGMMAQLMTREVLEEPMSELASKYPAYLASPPSTVSQADLAKYEHQHLLVKQITDTFRRQGYSDEKDGKEIARLVGEMQDLGGPPKEIMGELPEGFDLGALRGAGTGDECNIM